MASPAWHYVLKSIITSDAAVSCKCGSYDESDFSDSILSSAPGIVGFSRTIHRDTIAPLTLLPPRFLAFPRKHQY